MMSSPRNASDNIPDWEEVADEVADRMGDDITELEAAIQWLTVQRAIVTYPGSDYTWTYPVPFEAGVVPVIEAVAVGPAASNALFNVQLVGDPTNTSAKFRVNTIPAASINLVGLLTLTLFQQAPNNVKLHLTARAP